METLEKLAVVYGHITTRQHSQLDSEYLQQAINFLYHTDTTIIIKYAYQGKPENWDIEKPVNVYRVTLRNKNHEYSFNFYSSLHDTYGPSTRGISWNAVREHEQNNNRKIRIYDVLACLQIDYSEDFEDFCNNFGYLTDSMKALKVYNEVRTETKNIKKLWPDEESQKMLADIN